MRTEGEVDHRCVNVTRPAKLQGTILHFASRHVVNIDGLGEALVNQITERGLVITLPRPYWLTKKQEDVTERSAATKKKKFVAP